MLIRNVSNMPARMLRLTTRRWMIAIAGLSVVLAWVGVTLPLAIVVSAFVLSALIAKPDSWQVWLILLVGAIAALPLTLFGYIHAFAIRAALFLGHWPYFAHPDPKDLPGRFHSQYEFIDLLIPVMVSVSFTSLFASLVCRFARPSRKIPYAIGMTLTFWVLSLFLLILDPTGVVAWYMD